MVDAIRRGRRLLWMSRCSQRVRAGARMNLRNGRRSDRHTPKGVRQPRGLAFMINVSQTQRSRGRANKGGRFFPIIRHNGFTLRNIRKELTVRRGEAWNGKRSGILTFRQDVQWRGVVSEESPSSSCQRVFVRNCGFYRINEKYRQAGFHWDLQGKTKQNIVATITFSDVDRVPRLFGIFFRYFKSVVTRIVIPSPRAAGAGLAAAPVPSLPVVPRRGPLSVRRSSVTFGRCPLVGRGPAVFFSLLGGPSLPAT